MKSWIGSIIAASKIQIQDPINNLLCPRPLPRRMKLWIGSIIVASKIQIMDPINNFLCPRPLPRRMKLWIGSITAASNIQIKATINNLPRPRPLRTPWNQFCIFVLFCDCFCCWLRGANCLTKVFAATLPLVGQTFTTFVVERLLEQTCKQIGFGFVISV